MMKPIPKRLLPHNCIYKKYLSNTGEGDLWDNDIPLNHVKIEIKRQMAITSNGREVIGNGKMFYDLVNSIGLTDVPVENSKILFNGKTYVIESYDILCSDNDIPHHYEFLLK